MNTAPGRLFVVGTPIGNLRDITFRAVECMKESGLIAAEDTRRTRKLLSHLGIKKKVISCNEYNEAEKAGLILDFLKHGNSAALVSDAGTPGLSDPGARLVALLRKSGVEIVPVPGPSAATAALSVSGFPGRSFHFAGFLPSRAAERRQRLQDLLAIETVIVFFEAPHRLLKSLRDILEILGDRKIFLAREMTKSHETCIFATVGGLIKILEKEKIRGEITLVLEGAGRREKRAVDTELLESALRSLLEGEKISVKEASRLLSKLCGTRRSLIYNMALDLQDE